MSRPEEFFIGWAPAPPRGLRRWLAAAAVVGLLGLPALGLLLGAAADDPADAAFATVPGQALPAELPTEMAVQGVLVDGPYPLLHLPATPGLPRGRTLLLSGDGKAPPPLEARALHGRLVAAEGFALRRGSIEMLVMGAPPRPVTDAPAPAAPSAESLGRWRITGEVCDGKCAAGGMRPGIGLAHRACATLCLDSAIPAVFVPTAPVAGHAVLLLADHEGRAGIPAFRDAIGRRVTLEGAVERLGSLLVFRAEAP
jgi:hypothetical protein